jgi:Holliday junction resolvase RusA-like endonuclease
MSRLEFNLTFPPSTNNLFANKKSGGRVPSTKYKSWRAEAGWEINRQRLTLPNSMKGVPGDQLANVRILVNVARVSAARDLDNLIKPILDLLVNMQVLIDDTVKYVNLIEIRLSALDRPSDLLVIVAW